MAPAVLLAQDADFIDLDGPLILREDPQTSPLVVRAVTDRPLPELD